jgi:hypothetical protein
MGWKTYGNLGPLWAVMHILILANTCQLIISRHFAPQLPIAGQKSSIGTKTPVMYLGMSFYHALQTSMASDSALSRQFSCLLMSQ